MAKGMSGKIKGGSKPPKQSKIKGISTPFHNRIANVGGKR